MYKTEVKCIVFVFLHYNRHMGEKQGSNVQIGDTVSLIDKILQFVCAGSLVPLMGNKNYHVFGIKDFFLNSKHSNVFNVIGSFKLSPLQLNILRIKNLFQICNLSVESDIKMYNALCCLSWISFCNTQCVIHFYSIQHFFS